MFLGSELLFAVLAGNWLFTRVCTRTTTLGSEIDKKKKMHFTIEKSTTPVNLSTRIAEKRLDIRMNKSFPR
jgi:hypothetical protein